MLHYSTVVVDSVRPDQYFQQFVEIPLNPFAQHEAVIAGKLAGVVARPQDQVIRLRDNRKFFVVPASRHQSFI